MRRGSLPGNLLADHILDAESPVKALIVLAGNPLFTIGGEERLREAFESLELIVCIDLYRNATGDLAHWLLPSTDMFERPDINITGPRAAVGAVDPVDRRGRRTAGRAA